jgi:hypothetical protein
MAVHWLFLRLSPECGFPKFVSFFMLPQNAFIFALFFDFYRKTYGRKKVSKNGEKNDINANAELCEPSSSKGSVKMRTE